MTPKPCYIGWCFTTGARDAQNEERRQAFEMALARHVAECPRCQQAAAEELELEVEQRR